MLKLEMPMLQEASNENESLLAELLCKFRQWLKQQIHLPQDISDQRLKFIILAVKFDFEKAKKKLDILYTIRNVYPDFYHNFDPFSNDVQEVHKYFQFVSLPKLTSENCRIHMSRIVNKDSSIYNIYAVVRYIILLFEARMEEDIVSDIIIIWDYKDITIQHVLKYTPTIIKVIDTCVQAYCARVKAIYLINSSQSIDIFMKVAKSIMKGKLFNRIHVYTSGIESVYNAVPKSLLPVDYGGEQPSMDTLTDMWRAKFTERRNWFLEQNKHKVNESLRTNSVINPNDLFGVPGTFKQISID